MTFLWDVTFHVKGKEALRLCCDYVIGRDFMCEGEDALKMDGLLTPRCASSWSGESLLRVEAELKDHTYQEVL